MNQVESQSLLHIITNTLWDEISVLFFNVLKPLSRRLDIINAELEMTIDSKHFSALTSKEDKLKLLFAGVGPQLSSLAKYFIHNFNVRFSGHLNW